MMYKVDTGIDIYINIYRPRKNLAQGSLAVGYKHATTASAKQQDTERLSDRVGFPEYGPDPRLVMF